MPLTRLILRFSVALDDTRKCDEKMWLYFLKGNVGRFSKFEIADAKLYRGNIYSFCKLEEWRFAHYLDVKITL